MVIWDQVTDDTASATLPMNNLYVNRFCFEVRYWYQWSMHRKMEMIVNGGDIRRSSDYPFQSWDDAKAAAIREYKKIYGGESL